MSVMLSPSVMLPNMLILASKPLQLLPGGVHVQQTRSISLENTVYPFRNFLLNFNFSTFFVRYRYILFWTHRFVIRVNFSYSSFDKVVVCGK